MKSRLYAAAALLVVAAPAAGREALHPAVPALVGSPMAGDLLEATVHRLDNGLTIYLSENHQKPRISAWIAVRAGGKHDPEDSTGMAHYLEHMLFKGTERMGTLDYGREKPHLDRILALYEELFDESDPDRREAVYKAIDEENVKAGAYAVPNELDKAYRQMGFQGVNAFTGNEYTVYVCDFPSNRAEHWARVEADRFASPVFRLFQTEIETVYEEKNRSLDHEGRIIGEALDRLLYKEHPYGQRTVLGSIEHLKNPSLKKMYAYYAAHYVPNNMCIALAGDFKRRKMLALLERHFGAWEAAPLPEVRTWPLPPPEGVERVEVKYEAEEQVIIAWPTVPERHPDRDALVVMDMLMDNSTTGIINLELNQAQKVKQAGSYPELHNDAGSWNLHAVPKKGQTLEEAEALLMGTVASLKAGKFTDEDMKAIITNFEIGEKRNLESNGSRVGEMAFSFLQFKEWRETVESLDRLRAVTRDDVLRVARAYLGDDRVVAYRRNGKPELPSITKPEFTKIPIDDAKQSAFFREVTAMRAKPIKPRWAKRGRDYGIRDTRWGRLYAGPNPVNDLFSLNLGFKFGAMHEKALAEMAGLLELSGAGDLSADEFKKALYRLGTSLSFSTNERWFAVSLSGLDEHFERSLDLLDRLLREPNVDADTLEKMVQVRLGAQQDNKKNPRYVHHALLAYGRRGEESDVLQELSAEELEALKLGRLREVTERLRALRRDAVYVGDRGTEEVARLLDGGRDAYEPPPASRTIDYLEPERTRVLFTHRDMVQAQVGVFTPDGVLALDEIPDYHVYGSYLGGGMSSVIFQEIREARALAYAAWGGYTRGHWKGDENLLFGQLGCQADKTVEAAALLAELIRTPPLTEARLAETRKALEQAYRTAPLGFRDVPFTIMRWEEQGIYGDPRPGWFKRIRGYRLADLQAFAARFEGRPVTFAVLGSREAVDLDGLKKLGAFEEIPLDRLFPY